MWKDSRKQLWRLRESIKGMLSREQTKESGLQALNRWKLCNAIAISPGEGLYALTAYEKVKRVTAPPVYDEHVLLASTEPKPIMSV